MSAVDELHEWADRHEAWAKRQLGCVCVIRDDGSVTRFLCPLHADTDPCLTMATVTGRRRTGTIRRGVCTACGHRSERAGTAEAYINVRTMNPHTPRQFKRVFLFCPHGHEVVSAPVESATGRRLLSGDYSGERCGYGSCGWSA